MALPRPRASGRQHREQPVTWRVTSVRLLTRALAIVLGVCAYAFLSGVPHPPSTALGVAYGASALCLMVAAWRLMQNTLE
jgi:uncharacterized membrane protein